MGDPIVTDVRNAIAKYYTDTSYSKKIELLENTLKLLEFNSNKLLNITVNGSVRRSFQKISEALINKKPGDILIYCENIDRYLLFNGIDTYGGFMDRMEDEKLIQYQIVSTNDIQKFVFGYTHPANVELDIDVKNILEDAVRSVYGLHENNRVLILPNKRYDMHEVIVLWKEMNALSEYNEEYMRIENSIRRTHPLIANKMRNMVIETEPVIGINYSMHPVGPGIVPNANIWDLGNNLVGSCNTPPLDFDTIQIKYIQRQLTDKVEYIYFIIEEPFNNKVKIGKTSRDVDKRLAQLQTGNGSKLIVFHKIISNVGANLEDKLHKQCADRRLKGEWFRFTAEELKLVIIGL